MSQVMDVLLTNDDGYRSLGMAAIRDAMVEAGLRVLSVAPDGPRSGNSRSASFRKPVVMTRDGGDAVNPIYRADGTPVDCVRAAILSGLARDVRLVVSGINEGANLGDDATYSSTFGSAAEGALLGLPALSISQQSRDGRFRLVDLTGYDYGWCAQVGAELAAWMIASPPPRRSILNVNAPGVLRDRRLKATTLDHRVWDPAHYEAVETEAGDGWFTFPTNVARDPVFTMRRGSDASAVAAGHVSVTPVSFDFGNGKAARHLRHWLRRSLDVINPRLGASDGRCREGCCG
jgi:5'-nucleotidase